MKVELVSMTKPIKEEIKDFSPEEYLIYIARVSNPSNQLNTETAPGLVKYCLGHGHYSIFDMVDLTFGIETSRVIAAQLIRHKSAYWLPMDVQEFSQRYSQVNEFEQVELRKQATKNRQSSEEVEMSNDLKDLVNQHIESSKELYNYLLENEVSKETARMILPLCTKTRLYAKNSVRNWLAFLNQRLHKDTQKEHRLIAEEVKGVFIKEFPVISSCFDNFQNAYEEKFM